MKLSSAMKTTLYAAVAIALVQPAQAKEVISNCSYPTPVDVLTVDKEADWDWSNWQSVVHDCKVYSAPKKKLNLKDLKFSYKAAKYF